MATFRQFPVALMLAMAVVILATTAAAAAFTPDAAFKMKSLGLTPGGNNGHQNHGSSAHQQPQYQAGAGFGNDRNMQLSLIGQENVRKSITVPPAYEDYMAIRERSLLRLLQLNKFKNNGSGNNDGNSRRTDNRK